MVIGLGQLHPVIDDVVPVECLEQRYPLVAGEGGVVHRTIFLPLLANRHGGDVWMLRLRGRRVVAIPAQRPESDSPSRYVSGYIGPANLSAAGMRFVLGVAVTVHPAKA